MIITSSSSAGEFHAVQSGPERGARFHATGPWGDQFSESFEVFRDLTRKMCKLIDFGVNDYKKSRQNF